MSSSPTNDPESDVENIDSLDDTMSKIYEERLRDIAGKHMPKSIKTIAELRDDDAIAPSTRLKAANDLIKHGHKKDSHLKQPDGGAGTGKGDIIINVVRFGEGAKSEIIHTEKVALVDDVEPEFEPIPQPSPLPAKVPDGD